MTRAIDSKAQLLFVFALTCFVGGCDRSAISDDTADTFEPRTLDVFVAGGGDHMMTVVNSFLPSTVHIRAGDTINWKIGSGEPHTVVFTGNEELPRYEVPVPGRGGESLMINPRGVWPTRKKGEPVETYRGEDYITSGLLSWRHIEPLGPTAPPSLPSEHYSVHFDSPGTYPYFCMIHPGHAGVVVVEDATAVDVPSQADIDAMAQAELAPIERITDSMRAMVDSEYEEKEVLADGTNLWTVQVGQAYLQHEVNEFLPRQLEIEQGDTVLWHSPNFKMMMYVPERLWPGPAEVIIEPREGEDRPWIIFNPELRSVSKPPGAFDPDQFYSSGTIGYAHGTGKFSFSLTFNDLGTFKFIDALHRALGPGAESTITVVPRK
ncbi:MAG: cupredoxin domain-containing protein [Pseudomonadales bacterium]